MLIFRYNWLHLKNEAVTIFNNRYKDVSICDQIITLVDLMNGTLNNKYTKKQYHASLRLLADKDKPNFLINASSMLLYDKATIEDKCMLIFLASKRNFADYKLNGITSIPLILVKDYLGDYDCDTNPLLEIDGDIINFLN